MPKKLHFSGSSDDLVVLVDDQHGSDEYDAWGKPFDARIIDNNRNGLAVHGRYDGSGVWMFGISQLNEARELPPWPISFTQAENMYSVVLTVEVPDDATVIVKG